MIPLNVMRFGDNVIGGTYKRVKLFEGLLNNPQNLITINVTVSNKDTGEVKNERVLLGDIFLKNLEESTNIPKLRSVLKEDIGEDELYKLYSYREVSIGGSEKVLRVYENATQTVKELSTEGVRIIGVASDEDIKDYYIRVNDMLDNLYEKIKLESDRLDNYSLETLNKLGKNSLEVLNELSMCNSCGMYYRYYQMIISSTINEKSCCPHCLEDKGRYGRGVEKVSDKLVYSYLKDFVDCMELKSVNDLKEYLKEIISTKEEYDFRMKMANSVSSELNTLNSLTNKGLENVEKERESMEGGN